MASINNRQGKLYIDFRYLGMRCREQTNLTDTQANRRRVKVFLKKIEAEIETGIFRYEKYFPNSSRIDKIRSLQVQKESLQKCEMISFKDFSAIWLLEKKPEWKPSNQEYVNDIFRLYLNPHFGDKPVNIISKSDIMSFRTGLLNVNQIGKELSISRINHIMSPLGNVLVEAADRYGFECAWRNIKQLTVPKSRIQPFSLDEVKRILDFVRDDFKTYYTVRFFTGLRTGEIDGLTWKKVDFKRRQLIIDCALQKDGTLGTTKNQSSIRCVDMSNIVYDALQQQYSITGNKNEFVFCSKSGTPLNYKNVTRRIWYPMLQFLGLEKRRPYHTRHTTATLWLASGESPEWIAKQMGHSTTAMLFNVYSRYVPNLTRIDGSAFDALLSQLHTTK